MVKIQLVNVGVDTFVVNAYYTGENGMPVKREVLPAFAEQLDAWKVHAQNMREPYPTDFDFHGSTLLMQAGGAGQGQWQWMLKTPDITLYISRGRWNGIASVRFNWSCPSLTEAIVPVDELLYNVFQHELLHLQPSKVDIYADVAGWEDAAFLNKKRNFVSHSRKRKGHSETSPDEGLKADDHCYGLNETGYDFSSRGPMSLTMYNKTREIRTSGKTWFVPLWKARGWNEEEYPNVWRVEAKLGREVLRDIKQGDALHGIEDAYHFEALLPVLWAYAVGHVDGGADGLPDGWLRCVLPTSDKNRVRCPTHPAWKVLQNAFMEDVERPAHFGKIQRGTQC